MTDRPALVVHSRDRDLAPLRARWAGLFGHIAHGTLAAVTHVPEIPRPIHQLLRDVRMLQPAYPPPLLLGLFEPLGQHARMHGNCVERRQRGWDLTSSR